MSGFSSSLAARAYISLLLAIFPLWSCTATTPPNQDQPDIRPAIASIQASITPSTAPLTSSPVSALPPEKKTVPTLMLWSKTYGSQNNDWCQQSLETKDGNIVIVGGIEIGSKNKRRDKGFVLKLDPAGKVLWQRKFGGTKSETLYGVQEAADGGYVAAGATGSFGLKKSSAWVLKLGSAGNILWQKAYGGRARTDAYAIDLTSDNGSIIAGMIGPSAKKNQQSDDAWVVKLDQKGSVVWQKRYGGEKTDSFSSIREAGDKGFIAAGTSSSFSSSHPDIWIVKLRSDGTIEWQKLFSQEHDQHISSIQPTADNGYVATGWFYTADSGSLRMDIFVWKLRSDGSVDWQKNYVGHNGAEARVIRQTTDNGFLLGGATHGFMPGGNNTDLLLVKLDSQGEIVWQRRYGGDRYDIAADVRETGDKAYIAVGSTYSFASRKVDVWVLKISNEGTIAFPRGSKLHSAKLELTAAPGTVLPIDTNATALDTDAKVQKTRAKVASSGFQTTMQAGRSKPRKEGP